MQAGKPIITTRFFNNPQGFTLVELMVVVIIVGILASSAVFMFANPKAQLRAEAFKLMGDLNLARSGAVDRVASVRIDFLFDADIDGDGTANEDGYWICVDDDGTDGCGAGDTQIKKVAFDTDVQFYDRNIAGGPDVIPGTNPPAPLDMADGDLDNDGVDCDFAGGVDDNGFFMRSNGTPGRISPEPVDEMLNECILYIYMPRDNSGMRAPPLAIAVTPSTGRIRLERWRPELGVNGQWSRK